MSRVRPCTVRWRDRALSAGDDGLVANRYLRAGATGANNGTDWTNAYTNKQTAVNALARATQDVLYVAAGSYGTTDLNLNIATSGTNRLTIKKATVADHGTDTGWSDSFATGQAVFGHVQIESSFWTFNGVTGGGPSAWTTGHGFKVDVSGGNGAGFQLGFSSTANSCIISHVEVVGDLNDESSDTNDAFWIGTSNDNVFSYCYSHDMGRCHFFTNRGFNGSLIEYCALGSFRSTSPQHAEAMALHSDATLPTSGQIDDWTVRYCLITHAEGTGGLMTVSNNFQVYGCVFAPLFGNTLGGGNGIVGTWAANTITNLKVYNCTFIDCDTFIIGILNSGDTGEFRNNIVYSSEIDPGYLSFLTHTHNHYIQNTASISESNGSSGTGDPFVDWTHEDFRLTAAAAAGIPAGTNLGSGGTASNGVVHSWNVDMLGNARTSQTRGALEFATAVASNAIGATRAN